MVDGVQRIRRGPIIGPLSLVGLLLLLQQSSLLRIDAFLPSYCNGDYGNRHTVARLETASSWVSTLTITTGTRNTKPRRLLHARSICTFDETDFAGAAGDTAAFESASSTTISFNRLDNSNDSQFYKEPRFVNHIDDAAIEALRSYYQSEFQESYEQKGNYPLDILDLCSSWTSHFPEEAKSSFEYGRVVGLGMNEEELKGNPFLTETIVQDLNQEPSLKHKFPEDACFDVITMAVSVDYLIQPLTVFQEIHRLLRPGTGKALISFSNRCFPTKAIATWLQADDLDRLTLVASYFHYSSEEGWSLLEALDLKDATLEVPKRPSAQEIFKNPSVGLAWMNSAAAVQRSNAGDPMFVVKGVKTE